MFSTKRIKELEEAIEDLKHSKMLLREELINVRLAQKGILTKLDATRLRMDDLASCNKSIVNTLKVVSECIDGANAEVELSLQTSLNAIPNYGKIRMLVQQYDSKDKALKLSDCPAFDEFLLKGMQDIEKEIELLVALNKGEPGPQGPMGPQGIKGDPC